MFEIPPKKESAAEETERERNDRLALEYADLIALYETPPVPPEDRVECGPVIAEFETLLADFETTHDLEALHAIVRLTPEDAPNCTIRESAKKSLIPIVAKLNYLEEQTNISEEQLDLLKARYKKLSRAVGMINSDIVDHTR